MRRLLVLAFLVAGCAHTLPVDPRWAGGGCGVGVGTDMVIHGSATDPRVRWATSPDTNERFEIVWPVGYSARFEPDLEVLNARGRVVAREGYRLIGWCRVGDTPNDVPTW